MLQGACQLWATTWLRYLNIWLKDAGLLLNVGRSLPHYIPLVTLILQRDLGDRPTPVGLVNPDACHVKQLWEANL